MKTIEAGVKSILERLDNSTVLINKLKQTPRTGFEVRIKKFSLNLPVQSIYDHVLSVATNSDILATLFNIDLDIEKIIYSIAFHDIVEALIGDTPEFTSKELIKFSQKYSVNTKEKAIQEQKANNQISQ